MPLMTYANNAGADKSAESMLHFSSKYYQRRDASVVETAGAATYTAAQILGGVILRDPSGSARTDVLPTAALLLATNAHDIVGMVIECLIVNNADAAETITITAGDGGTITQVAGTCIIPQNTSRIVYIRIDSATAYTAWM